MIPAETGASGIEVKTIVAYTFSKEGPEPCCPAQVALLKQDGTEVADSAPVEPGVVLTVVLSAMAWHPVVRSWVKRGLPRAEELEVSVFRLSEHALSDGTGLWGSAPAFTNLVRTIDDLLRRWVAWEPNGLSIEDDIGEVMEFLLNAEQAPDGTPSVTEDCLRCMYLD